MLWNGITEAGSIVVVGNEIKLALNVQFAKQA
jgi:hypothetical protein